MKKMLIDDNGTIREMTAEEIAEYEKAMAETPKPEPTENERLEALESAMLTMMMGGM